MTEHPRALAGNDGDVRVTLGPDHTAPLTWLRCNTAGCDARVDPWDHNTRCPEHRPPADHRGDMARAKRREIARAIVAEYRRPSAP